MLLDEGGNDRISPDLQVVVSPAFNRELGLTFRPNAPYAGQADQPKQKRQKSFQHGNSDRRQRDDLKQSPNLQSRAGKTRRQETGCPRNKVERLSIALAVVIVLECLG